MRIALLLGVFSLAALVACGVTDEPGAGPAVTTTPGTQAAPATQEANAMWMDISSALEKELIAQGKKIGWPGQGSAGVGVDHRTGDVYMVMSDLGIWKSVDRGKTFGRFDDGSASGRCESGYSLQTDPADGQRLAYIGIWGQSTMTLDGGKSWLPIKDPPARMAVLAVDWSDPEAQSLATIVTHSSNRTFLTHDRGKTWKDLGTCNAIGLFDARTIVASRKAGGGIERSVDDGQTWEQVSELTPDGRAMFIRQNVGYWVSKGGVLLSKDKGKTWSVLGKPVEAYWGPYFGRSDRELAVVGPQGFMVTRDGGGSWDLAAPISEMPWKKEIRDRIKEGPANFGQGWFMNFGWDPVNDVFYLSKMGRPTCRYDGKK